MCVARDCKAGEDKSHSSSEYDIFSPKSSEGNHSPKQKGAEEDDKFNNLHEEARAIEKMLPWCVMNPYGRPKQVWDLVMIMLLVYTYEAHEH